MSGQAETPIDLTHDNFTVRHAKKKYSLFAAYCNDNANQAEADKACNNSNNDVGPQLVTKPKPAAPSPPADSNSNSARKQQITVKYLTSPIKGKIKQKSPEERGQNPLMRGKHGLRPLPQQVDYYQSVLEDKKAKSFRDVNKGGREDDQDALIIDTIPAKRARRSAPDLRRSNVKDERPSRESSTREHFVVGDIVWATLPSYKTWFPGLIISHLHCGQKPARSGHTWVYWFGDHQVSEIPKAKVKSFIAHFNDFSKGTSSLTSSRMKEALQVLASRAGLSFATTNNANADEMAYINWAKNGFDLPPENTKEGNPFAPDPMNPIPAIAACYLPLDALHQEALKTDDRLQQIAFYEVESAKDSEEKDEPLQIPEFKQSQVDRIKKGEIKITDICIACCCDHNSAADTINGAKMHHPLFEGLLCKQCQETLKCTMYAPGEDNKNSFCAVCGQVGKLAVCDNQRCHRVFCFVCIDLYVGSDEHSKIVEAQTWDCYVCNEKELPENSLLKPKKNWRDNVKAIFDPICSLQPVDSSSFEKKPIKILSLYDGLSAVKTVLEKLKFQISAYYACETDRDAVAVSQNHHGVSIEYLDRIENLTPDKIASICPIDLVVCSSSSLEYSLSNSSRRGLSDLKGIGHPFLYFNHILNLIRLFNKDHHVFFLYENVSSIPNHYRDMITTFTMCKPVTMSPKTLTVSEKIRYIWSNIPGVNRPLHPDLKKNIESFVPEPESDAKVNSQDPPLAKDLEVNNLEKMLGFENDYTNISTLSKYKRYTLLQRSWSVPVSCHILWALCDFFKTDG